MTAPKEQEQAMELLPVTQADRDLAAHQYRRIGKPGMAELIETAGQDDNPTVQLLARYRHRLAHQPPASTDAGKLAEELNPVVVAITEAAVLHLDADEDNAAQLAAFERALLPILTVLRQTSQIRAEAIEPDLLAEFAKHRNWELSYEYFEEEEGAWQVHSVNGGVNDRVWTLIGAGYTPAAAITAAIRTLAQPPVSRENDHADYGD